MLIFDIALKKTMILELFRPKTHFGQTYHLKNGQHVSLNAGKIPKMEKNDNCEVKASQLVHTKYITASTQFWNPKIFTHLKQQIPCLKICNVHILKCVSFSHLEF